MLRAITARLKWALKPIDPDYKFEDVKMYETNLGLYAGYNFKF